MKIPKIIHQTWKTKRIPRHLKILEATWKQHHSDWIFYLWTDKANRSFVKKNFPELLEKYDAFEVNIQRVDMIRYLILFKLGGIYIDMDFECFMNLEPLLKDDLCVFALEPDEHCLMHGKNVLLCNAFIGSVPNHPFLKLLIEESVKPIMDISDPNTRVMETTGPFMVTRVFQDYKNSIPVRILDAMYVYPLTRREIILLISGRDIEHEAQLRLNGSVAVHYWLNSWVV